MSSCVMEQVRCLERADVMLLKRFKRAASSPGSSLLLLLLLLDEDEDEDEDEDDAGESTDKAVLAEVPSSSSSSSTAARFLPRPLVCLDAAVVAFLLLDILKVENRR